MELDNDDQVTVLCNESAVVCSTWVVWNVKSLIMMEGSAMHAHVLIRQRTMPP